MMFPALVSLVPVLLGLADIDDSSPMPNRRGGETAAVELWVEERVVLAQSDVIMRIPLRPRAADADGWKERKGPKCVSTDDIRGAVLSGPNSIDFLMRGRQRIRAEVSESCPALDFYSGFYLSPEDDRICAGRDPIRSRMGGQCEIERFLELRRKR